PPTHTTSTLSLHDALPIWYLPGPRILVRHGQSQGYRRPSACRQKPALFLVIFGAVFNFISLVGCGLVLPLRPGSSSPVGRHCARSEEHTSELQSRGHLVCR